MNATEHWIRLRLGPALFAMVSLIAGCLARGLIPHADFAWWKWTGVLLWVWIVYGLVRVVAPEMPPWRVAAWTIGISWATECFQLTGIPHWMSERSTLLRLAFGEVFSVADLVAVTVSGLLAVPFDVLLRRAERWWTRPRAGVPNAASEA